MYNILIRIIVNNKNAQTRTVEHTNTHKSTMKMKIKRISDDIK